MDLCVFGSLLLEEWVFKFGVDFRMTGKNVVQSALFSANLMLREAIGVL